MPFLFLLDYHCPACNELIEQAWSQDIAPTEGIFGFCFHCGHMVVWHGNGFKSATVEEVKFLRDQDPKGFDEFIEHLRNLRESQEPLGTKAPRKLPAKPQEKPLGIQDGRAQILPNEDGTVDWWLQTGEIGTADTIEEAVMQAWQAALERDNLNKKENDDDECFPCD